MSQDRVMLLIDADNVSVDVMEQAVRLLLNQHGGLHVRRAYCTAESAVSNQVAFKRLGIKPMVNLAAGKNSTDIALAVDAIDLVLAERPDVVVIASSDSDFAPLVHRLREKGCVVRGIGQKGKTGDETQEVYDDFTVLEHHRAIAGEVEAGKPARKTARKTARDPAREPARKVARKTAVPVPAVDKAEPAKKAPAARKVAARANALAAPSQESAAEDLLTAPERTPKSTPAAKPAARKTAARKSAGAAVTGTGAAAGAAGGAAGDAAGGAAGGATGGAAPGTAGAAAGSARGSARGTAKPSGTSVQAVLACLPEVAAGKSLALNVAVRRLRESQLLGKNSSSLKLFAQLSDQFELLPVGKPTQVRLRH